jgi:hypothetical protein
MARNRTPAPPVSDNPIIVLQGNPPDFLAELLDARNAGDVGRAARCVIAALSSAMRREMVDAAVGLVNNMAFADPSVPSKDASVTAMLCKAADLGFHEYAYNAANQIMSGAKSVEDYKDAERYYRLAMAFEEKPAIQAAAHVNYCPIVRDGLISGVPDWPASVEIYEVAARMGLVKAMFNAGNMSCCLCDKGDRAYGARAAYWFNYALEVRASGKPTLDVETAEQLETEIFEECMVALSALHIDSKFDGAELEEGIRWAREAAEKGIITARYNLGIGHIHRLSRMTTKPQRSPGGNWRSVLSEMDWQFKGRLRAESVPVAAGFGGQAAMTVDRLTVELSDGTDIPLFVTHAPCLPDDGGIEQLSEVGRVLAYRYPDGFFLLSRKAFLIAEGEWSYTPIYVLQNGKLSRQALWMGSSPDVVLQHAQDGVDFLDQRFRTWSCMIPIAVNALDEGFVVATDATLEQTWVSVGEPWRMPFVDEVQLFEFGIVLAR